MEGPPGSTFKVDGSRGTWDADSTRIQADGSASIRAHSRRSALQKFAGLAKLAT
jgi:hypothetical protein